MDAIYNILSRKSVRHFLDRELSKEEIHEILKAGMSGPSAANTRPWDFIVVTDRKRLNEMADANGETAEPLRTAALGILICGNTSRAIESAPDYWIIDASIAAQNMVLAAHAMEIGSVWLGTWPREERVKKQAELFGLPENIVPHSIIAFGYPKEDMLRERDQYEEERVHFGKW